MLVGADMDQLELRIYAWVSGDKILWDAITQGLDPHAMNAATMFARGPSEVQQWYDNIVTWKKSPDGELVKKAKQMRNIAKRFAFLECYGGEDDKLYETMSTDRNPATGKLQFPGLQLDRVLEWHENWHKIHPETRIWHNKCWTFMREHGYIAAPWFDKRRRFGPLDKKNAVPNMQIQGGAGSMMNQMMIAIAERIPHRGWSPLSGPIAQVHDEFLVCVPQARAEEAKKIMEEEMNFTFEGMEYTAEAGISRSWARQ
jgi:DNA polymerase I-like protein with 3'-5' exonuclease and polymerase domains